MNIIRTETTMIPNTLDGKKLADEEEWRDCREPYEDSLVNVCNEIERKVKGALWMI